MSKVSELDVLNQYPISSWAYPRILVGIPLERAISYADRVFWPFMNIAMQAPAFIQDIPYGRIDVVRNNMVKKLLLSDYTHLLMLDVDHPHPADIIQRLAKWVIEHPEIRVVSGMNFRRKEPYDAVCGVYTTDENGNRKRASFFEWEPGLVEVDEMGGASLLVHRSVFAEMEPPWFFNVYEEAWENSFPGEDIGFCRKCQGLGIKMYVDTTTSSPHCTDGLVTEQTFKVYMQQHPERFVDAEL